MNGMMDGMMNDSSMMMAMCVMMFLGVLLLIAAIGATVYVVIRLLLKNKAKDRPLMLLKERYAKGEISEEEYKQKRKILSEG